MFEYCLLTNFNAYKFSFAIQNFKTKGTFKNNKKNFFLSTFKKKKKGKLKTIDVTKLKIINFDINIYRHLKIHNEV